MDRKSSIRFQFFTFGLLTPSYLERREGIVFTSVYPRGGEGGKLEGREGEEKGREGEEWYPRPGPPPLSSSPRPGYPSSLLSRQGQVPLPASTPPPPKPGQGYSPSFSFLGQEYSPSPPSQDRARTIVWVWVVCLLCSRRRTVF